MGKTSGSRPPGPDASAAALDSAPPEAEAPARWARLLDALRVATSRRAQTGPDVPDEGSARREAALAAVIAAWDPLPEPLAEVDARLARLGVGARLAPFDVDVLSVAVAAEVDPALAVLLDLLGPRPGALDRPTVAVVLELLGVPTTSSAARGRLGPGGALARSGLLRLRGAGPLGSPLLAQELVLPERVLAHLLGDAAPDPALEPFLLGVPDLVLPGHEQLVALWSAGEPLVWVRGAAGSAGSSLAVGAATSAGRPSVVVDLGRALLAGGPARHDAVLAAAALEAVLRGAVLVVTGVEAWSDRAQREGGLDVVGAVALLQGCGAPVAVVSHDPWDPAWAPTLPAVVPAPHLSVQDRATLWRSHLSDEPSEGDPSWQDLLALRVTPEEVDAVADLVRGEHGEPTVALLRDASRRLSGRGAAAVRPRATLEDLVLPAEVASGVRQLLAWARHRDQVLAQGPLMGKGKGAGITALFTGSPGTGKTLAANVIADSLGVDLYQVDLSGVVDKYVGETEKNLERVFRAAERLNCVLFFDEADSLFGSRSEVRDSRDRYANLEVSYLLQRMEQFDGIAVLATNLRGNLDVAFSRRLHFVLHFPDPDETTRAALWRQHLRHLAATDPQDPVDVEHLARVAEVAGGDIRNAVLAAAFTAADEGVPVGMRHVVGGLEREYRKLGRRVTAGGLAPRGA